MGVLQEMLLRNGLILRNSDGSYSTLSDCAVRSGVTITDSSGRVTHRIENSTWPGEFVLRNVSTDLVEERIRVA